MNIGDIFNLLLIQPTINFIVLILRVLEGWHVPGSLGLSIILLTIFIKLILWPFTHAQLKSAKHMSEKMALMKPELAELKKKHKDDKMAFSKAQKELYDKHGINPAGGCLPAIVQILLIFPLYQTVSAFLSGQDGLEKINYFLYSSAWHLKSLPDPHFLGVNLADKPSDFARIGILVLLIPLITALLQFIQSLMMLPKAVKVNPKDSPQEKTSKETTEEAMQAVQGQMVFMMPLMIGFFAWQFPVGLALYWNILSILGIFQQYRVSGWGKLENYVSKIRKK